MTLWSPEGAKLRSYASGEGAMAVAVDADGSIYMAEWLAGSFRVRKITPAGFTVWNSSTFGSAQGVAVTDGRVFVPTRDRVSILDAATGAPLGESPVLARPGDGFSMFDVDAADHRVYATINGRVHVLDTDGAELFSRHLGRIDNARIDVGRDGRVRTAWLGADVDVFDDAFTRLGGTAVTSARSVEEFGDRVYYVLFGDRVVMIDKPSELLPGGAQPAPEPPPPVPTPTPTPPPAEPSSGASAAVSIEGGALFTNEPEVQLQFVAPPGTTSTQVSNDGGFVPFSTVAGTENAPWTLARSGAERLPKTVYVRFLPSGLARQDDIILDQTAPNLIRAEARRTGKRYTLRVKAKDRASGLATLQVISQRRRTSSAYSERRRVALPEGKVSVRVRDRAGNWSRTRRVK